MNGVLVAIGYIADGGRQTVIGSGVMVAPGLCLTATHVLYGVEALPLISSFVGASEMRMWVIEDFHATEFKAELVQARISRWRSVHDMYVLLYVYVNPVNLGRG